MSKARSSRSWFFLYLEIGTLALVPVLMVIYRDDIFDSLRPKTQPKLPAQMLTDVSSPRWNGEYPCVYAAASPGSAPQIGRCATPVPMSDVSRQPVDSFETDLRRGKFILRQTDLSLKEAGFEIPLTRTYTPDDWLPQNKVHAFGLNANHPYDIAPLGTRNPYTEQFIVLEDGDFLYFPRVSPGTSYADAIFQQVESGNTFYKAVTRWDGTGWVTRLQDGATIRFPESYNAKSLAEGAPTEMVDKDGHKIELIRDWHRNLREIRGPDGASIKLDYDDQNRIVRAKDSRGEWVMYTYDSVGYLTSAIHSDGTVRSYSYEAGVLVSVRDQQNSLLLQNAYYPRSSWLSKQRFGNGNTIKYDYELSPNAKYAMKAILTMPDYSRKTVEIGDCISDVYKRIPRGGGTRNAAPSGSQKSANQTTQSTPSVESATPNNPGAPENPVDGSISGSTYTNNFFHLSLSFPEGWKVIVTDAGPQVGANGVTAYVLLMVGSADRQMHGTRWITIAAGRPPSGRRALSAEDYAKYAASAFKQFGGGDSIHLTGEPKKVRLGKRDIARFDVTAPVTIQGIKYEMQMTNSWTVERGYLLIFMSSDPAGYSSDDGSAAKALNSLNFFEKTE